ncbi:hypothetical protein [Mesorhizobium sp. M0895]|uniref:hypothetical protein n=1 Tax=Mesorhizobium sp. M0895 TaxID=2957019 RepID=UPI003339F1C7
MSAYIEKMQREIESLLNELSADHAVNRIILQTLLLNMASVRGPDLLLGVKQQVVEALQRSTPNPDDPQGGERKTQLTIMRAELFFQDLERALGIGENKQRDGSH